MSKLKFLIVKHGALGDVVRTSYFAKSLKIKYGFDLELSWVTSTASMPLLLNNPYIDFLTDNFSELSNISFDIIYSLDDEVEVLFNVFNLKTNKIIGAILTSSGATYTDDASKWFDMGLLSKLGKNEADKLKKKNQLGHAEIFKSIFNVDSVEPNFYLVNDNNSTVLQDLVNRNFFLLGINPYSGGRWPSKELPEFELISLIKHLSSLFSNKLNFKIVLFGAGQDKLRNQKIADHLGSSFIYVADTDESLMQFAILISKLSIMITSDSLGMHLAIAQKIPTLAFFSPTSAAEIDEFNICSKLISTAVDYCSYRKDCDNSSITSERIVNLLLNSVIFKLHLYANNVGDGS